MTTEQLADIEAIKRLKARYFRLMDTKRWQEWGEVFTKDGCLQWGPGADEVAEGRDTIVRIVSHVLKDAVSCHYGHMPEIEVIDAENARGVWAMVDLVDHPDWVLRGFGHYHEEYMKQGRQWRIHRTHLTRLREERTPKR